MPVASQKLAAGIFVGEMGIGGLKMSSWVSWGIGGGAGVGLLLLLFAIVQGFRSAVRIATIFLTAWNLALRGLWGAPRTIAALSAMIAIGAALQMVSTAFPRAIDEATLVTASVVWQGLMFTAIAAIVVNLHLLVIHDFLAPRWFGAETMFYRGDTLNENLQPRPARVALMLQAATLGLFIWIYTSAIGIASNIAVHYLPTIQPGYEGLTRFAAITGALFASFLLTTPLSLLRPALSMGLRSPLAQGMRLAMKHVIALYVLHGMLLIAPAVIGSLVVMVPMEVFPNNMIARGVGSAIFLIFSVVQTMAVETATVLFLNRAINQSRSVSRDAPSAAEVAA